MISQKDMNYLKELRWRLNDINNDYERAVYKYICFSFQEWKYGRRQSKNVTKEELLSHLCRIGLSKRRADGKLPDDRKVREAARELLKKGYPIVASSKNKGFYVAESEKEIDCPQKQNHERALALLAADKGYEKMRAFLSGQTRIFL